MGRAPSTGFLIAAGGGVATFSLSVDKAFTGYTLKTSSGLPSIISNPFDITPAAASQLVFSTQPPARDSPTPYP